MYGKQNIWELSARPLEKKITHEGILVIYHPKLTVHNGSALTGDKTLNNLVFPEQGSNTKEEGGLEEIAVLLPPVEVLPNHNLVAVPLLHQGVVLQDPGPAADVFLM
jgi:hypothetical protein